MKARNTVEQDHHVDENSFDDDVITVKDEEYDDEDLLVDFDEFPVELGGFVFVEEVAEPCLHPQRVLSRVGEVNDLQCRVY